MALTQLTPTENWTKIINDNFGKTDLANLNWHKVSPGCTWLNGASSQFNDLYYAQIGNAKLCLFEAGYINVPKLNSEIPCMRVAAEYAPSHVVSGAAQQTGYFAERTVGGGTDFIAWGGTDVGNIGNGNVSMVWIHLD